MEAKSRYQVMGELEAKKREYMAGRESLETKRVELKNKIKNIERKRSDITLSLDRELDDAQEELRVFEEQLPDKKKLLDDLVASVDESLKRFNTQS